MATFHFHQQVIKRSAGRSAVACAAYRHAARMVNEFDGITIDYQHKREVIHSEFVFPADIPEGWRAALSENPKRLRGHALVEGNEDHLVGAGAINASKLFWNHIQYTEPRMDSQLSHEVTIALPLELTRKENIELVRSFVAEHYSAKGKIADWVYHDLPGNPHVHLMSQLRPFTEDGLGPKTFLLRDENGDAVTSARGNAIYAKWAGGKEELRSLREGWEVSANVALAQAGHEARVDSRSLRDRGIATTPTRHRGAAANAMHEFMMSVDLETDDQEARAKQFRTFKENPQLVVDHIAREHSTFGDAELVRLIHRYAPSLAEARALLQRVGTLDSIVTIQSPIEDVQTGQEVRAARYTTWHALEEEEAMVGAAEGLLERRGFGLKDAQRETVLAHLEEAQGFAFSPEQRGAIVHVTDDRGLAVLAGYAGTGKSTVMSAVRASYEALEGGRLVVGGALAAKAAKGLSEASGIEARTLASWERAWDQGERILPAGSVFVMDEAGMVGSEQMKKVLEALNAMGAKAILVGDARQLQPIVAGAAFRAISEVAGHVELLDVRRQSVEWQAQASVKFARGETLDALSDYVARGHVLFEDDRNKARASVLDGWWNDFSADAQVQMIAHTNIDVRALNIGARAMIQDAGGLADEVDVQTTRGERAFAEGERVVFLRNDTSLGVQNGMFGTVTQIDVRAFEEDGREERSDTDGEAPRVNAGIVLHVRPEGRAESIEIALDRYADIEHGYAATAHKSQGATLDCVHVLGTNGFDAHFTYVAMTRHREDVRLVVALDSFVKHAAGRAHEAVEEGARPEEAIARLAQDRMKETTIAYRGGVDHGHAVRELSALGLDESAAEPVNRFVQARGMPLIGERFLEELSRPIRWGTAQLMSASERLRRAMRSEIVLEEGHDRAPKFPEISTEIGDALRRLDVALIRFSVSSQEAGDWTEGHGVQRYMRRVGLELDQGPHAGEVRAFNEAIAKVIPRDVVVNVCGPDPAKAAEALARVMPALDKSFKERVLGNWYSVYAGQRATTDFAWRTVVQQEIVPTEKVARPRNPIERIDEVRRPELLPAVTQWSLTPVQEAVQFVRQTREYRAHYRGANEAAGELWRDPVAALSALEALVSGGDDSRGAIVRDVVAEPQRFGELVTGSMFGTNAVRNAQRSPAMRDLVGELEGLVSLTERLVPGLARGLEFQRSAWGTALPGLSPAAEGVLSRAIANPSASVSSETLFQEVRAGRLTREVGREFSDVARGLRARFPFQAGPFNSIAKWQLGRGLAGQRWNGAEAMRRLGDLGIHTERAAGEQEQVVSPGYAMEREQRLLRERTINQTPDL